jgi:glycosyltransferase involved in cell wall biosynthesis
VDFEWIVHDGSPEPASMFESLRDARVHYVHEPKKMSIGAKRNAICEAARGEIIAQFDDDDYYAPNYIQRMLSFMKERDADFVKLFGFFLYCNHSRTFAYWDLECDLPIHFCLSDTEPPHPRYYTGGDDAQWGYGFSYVFYRRVWQAIHFPDRNHGEDHDFANKVVKQFKAAGMQDRDHLCLHVIHGRGTSITFPQRKLRRTQLEELFPLFSPRGGAQ